MAPTTQTMTPSHLVHTILRNLLLPLITAACFLVIISIYLWRTTPLYQASVSVTARMPQADPLAAVSSLGFGLLGNLGGRSTFSDYDRLVTLITSDDAAAALLANDELMQELFPGNWDSHSRTWRRPAGTTALLKRKIGSIFGMPEWQQPGTAPVIGFLETYLRISRSEGGVISTISLRAKEPELARRTLQLLIDSADKLLRERARKLNVDNIAFLRKQLSAEPTVEVRTELARQLGQELSKSTLLESNTSFAYAILKDFHVTTQPVSPRPTLTIFIGILAGLLVGSVIAVLRSSDWFHPTSPP